jgi:hypothetical protein
MGVESVIKTSVGGGENTMSRFTVRVELYEAQRADYNTLHAAMAQRGFSRLIMSDEGNTYELPWAEYDGSCKLSATQVLGITQKAAATTGRKNCILVTEAKSRAWSGLPVSSVHFDVPPHFEERLPPIDQESPVDDWA